MTKSCIQVARNLNSVIDDDCCLEHCSNSNSAPHRSDCVAILQIFAKVYHLQYWGVREPNVCCGHLRIIFWKILLPPANEVWGKVIFSEACVKNSVHRGGEYLGRYTPLGPGTPPQDQVHPLGSGTPPQDQVHPPGPGIPPGTRYTPQTRYTPGTRYTLRDQVHPPGPGTPPGGSACQEIWATSGRHASYWNAFLIWRSMHLKVLKFQLKTNDI